MNALALITATVEPRSDTFSDLLPFVLRAIHQADWELDSVLRTAVHGRKSLSPTHDVTMRVELEQASLVLDFSDERRGNYGEDDTLYARNEYSGRGPKASYEVTGIPAFLRTKLTHFLLALAEQAKYRTQGELREFCRPHLPR